MVCAILSLWPSSSFELEIHIPEDAPQLTGDLPASAAAAGNGTSLWSAIDHHTAVHCNPPISIEKHSFSQADAGISSFHGFLPRLSVQMHSVLPAVSVDVGEKPLKF
jgi:hypothetical protein